MGTRVYVGDLGDHGNQRELEDVFSHFGDLKEVWIAKDPKGFAFVEFLFPEHATSAIKQIDGSTVCGCKVRVEMARDSRRGRGRGRFFPRGSTSYRRSSPPSYQRERRDDRGPRGPSFRDRDVGYYDRDHTRTSSDNYIGSRRDVYTPPTYRGDTYRGRSDYEGPRNTDPYYESNSYRSTAGTSYGSRSISGYEPKARDYSPSRRDLDYGSSGPRGYVGSAPTFRDDQHSSYDNDSRGYYRRDDYHSGGGISTRNGDKFRYGGRSPMRSPRRSFRDRSPY